MKLTLKPGRRLRHYVARHSSAGWNPVKNKKILFVYGLVFLPLLAIGGGAYAAIQLGGVQDSVNLQSGLVGWWQFDGNALDSSGNGDNGTVYNATLSSGHDGSPNSAYSFTGASNSYINAGYGTTGSPLSFTTNFSLSAWINPSSYQSSSYYGLENGILARGTASTYNYALQATNANEISFYKRTGSEGLQHYDFTGVPTLTNQWTLVTATISGNILSLYINGTLFGTQTVNNIAPGSSDPMYLGTMCGGTALCGFIGSIDDIRVYNRVLNPTEAKALYTSHNSYIKAASGENGLVGWWKMDGNAKDATPNANNGTVTGATLTADREGKANSAYSFNGTSNYISSPVSTSSILNTGTSNWTISAWIKPSSHNVAQGITGTWTNASAPYWYLRLDSTNKLYLRLEQNNANGTGYYSTGTITDNNWHYVAVSIARNGLATFYIDGSPSGTADVSAFNGMNLTYSSSEFNIGNIGNHNSGNFFAGSIDDVRIYNRALSAGEVANLYGSYNSQVTVSNLQSGLVGDWAFNGNAKDSTPYSDNGTVNGATLTTDRKGRPNSAYAFNGSGNYIGVANSNSLNGFTALTVSCWFEGNLHTGNLEGIVAKDTGGGGVTNNPYALWDQSGTLTFFTDKSGDNNVFISVPNFNDNTWYHAVGTWDGTTMRLYVNGVLVGTNSQSAIASTTGNLQIGQQKNGSSRWFNGSIDDVRVYNRALSAAEVQALYNEYQ